MLGARSLAALAIAAPVAACAALAGIDDPAPIGISDGGTDANPDANPALPFCARHADAAVCSDFEVEGTVASGWTQQRGNVTRTTDLVGAGDASALSSLAAVKGGCNYADLRKQVDGNYSAAHFEMLLRPGFADAAPASGVLFSLGGGVEPKSCSFLAFFDGAPVLKVQNNGNTTTLGTFDFSPKGGAGAYAHVAIDLFLKSGATAVTLTIDGTRVLDLSKDNTSVLAGCALGGSIGASVGIYCNGGVDEARFDDVALEVR